MNRKINLEVDDRRLLRISQEMGLGLSQEEMTLVQERFRSRRRTPTELELQAIGQAWSEHCSYKSSLPLLHRFIIGIPSDVEIVLSEDAAVVGLDDEYVYVVALESHNHPSAIEPYGGAATGVGGVIRDVLCMGALPIALLDGLFFASPTTATEAVPPGTKAPRYLLNRVVEGISDYGNRMGIPTCAGMIALDPGYLTNCLVNVGCIGVARRDDIVRSRVTRAGEILVLTGGKTGRDGIHGVTFASANLAEESRSKDRSAVQLGDPIVQEPLVHACLQANEHRLISGMKDLGGGGLSCAVVEMVAAAGLGARIDLDRVHLREPLDPWEIWISESQERMLLAIAPENLDEAAAIFARWRVEFHPLGAVIEEQAVLVEQAGEELARLETDFLLNAPQPAWSALSGDRAEPHTNSPPKTGGAQRVSCPFPEPADYNRTLLDLLGAENIASRAFVVRRYDHEVGARTVTKPLQGGLVSHSPADAVIIKPRIDSPVGLALTCDVNPRFTARDPFWGAASAVDEVCRNLAAAGATAHSLADCLCLGDPRVPQQMASFEQICRGLHFVAAALGIPFVSGNVSLYNETESGPIPPTPTLIGVGVIKDIGDALTADLKGEGNLLFLIGRTEDELAGSEYLALLGMEEGIVPKVDPEQLGKDCAAMVEGAANGIIATAHDISAGGLGVCLAELTFGGSIGCRVDLHPLGDLRSDIKLFSESNSRFIVEIAPRHEQEFHRIFHGCSVDLIGRTGGRRIEIHDGRRELVDLSIDEARAVWEHGLAKYFQEERWMSAS